MTLNQLYRERARIADLIESEESRLAALNVVNTGRVLRQIADLYTVTVDEILSKSREDRVVKARHAACWVLRYRGLSLPRIGAVIGRDHTTVMYACAKVDDAPEVRALLWPLIGKVAS